MFETVLGILLLMYYIIVMIGALIEMIVYLLSPVYSIKDFDTNDFLYMSNIFKSLISDNMDKQIETSSLS